MSSKDLDVQMYSESLMYFVRRYILTLIADVADIMYSKVPCGYMYGWTAFIFI
jgi:hypothetical protein